MTITHVVSFKYATSATEAQRDVAFEQFMALKDTCTRPNSDGEIKPYIASLVGGKVNIFPRSGMSKGYDHMFVATFSTAEDFNYYLKEDPMHKAYGALVREVTAATHGGDVLIYDFEN